MVSPVLDPPLTGPRTMQTFLGLTREDIAVGLQRDMLLAAAKDEQKKFAAWLQQADIRSLRLQVAEHVCDAMKEDLVSAFAGAWAKYTELKSAAQDTRDDPKSTAHVSLSSHDFSYEMNFSVDVLMNEVEVAVIPFKFVLTCQVKGLELFLKGGSVCEVRSGAVDCTAEIQCAGQTVWARPLADVNLPSELHLRHPIAIA